MMCILRKEWTVYDARLTSDNVALKGLILWRLIFLPGHRRAYMLLRIFLTTFLNYRIRRVLYVQFFK